MKHFDTNSTTEYQGYTVKIQHDSDPMHPRKDEEFSTYPCDCCGDNLSGNRNHCIVLK